MKKLILISTIILIQIGSISAQKTVGGVTLPKKVMIGKTVMALNGAGVREKFWIDMYACGLYLKKKSSSAKEIINANEHSSLKIQIISGLISSKKMTDAVEEGFKNSAKGNIKDLRKRIDQFKLVFSKEEIQKGDVYDIIYVPSRGVLILKNGKGHPLIEGLDFKKALFAIWIGDKPADKDLKISLLGK